MTVPTAIASRLAAPSRRGGGGGGDGGGRRRRLTSLLPGRPTLSPFPTAIPCRPFHGIRIVFLVLFLWFIWFHVSEYSLTSSTSMNLVLEQASRQDDDEAAATIMLLATQYSQYPSTLTAQQKASISPTTVVTMATDGSNNKMCQCDLVTSLDCLDNMACLPCVNNNDDDDDDDDQKNKNLIRLGMEYRTLLKETTTQSQDFVPRQYLWIPIGKAMQYSAIETLHKYWIQSNTLPRQYNQHSRSIFVDNSRYPTCRERDLHGLSCFFKGISHNDENDNDDERLGVVEQAARKETHPLSEKVKTILKEQIEQVRTRFLYKNNTNNSANQGPLPALGALLAFAHIARLLFQPRRFMRDLYQQHLKIIPATTTTTTSTVGSSSSSSSKPLRVSLYLRRADACGHRRSGWETAPSSLDSPAQTTNHRKCYATDVYLNVLKRIQQHQHATGRPLHVYLSTDYAGSLVSEIKQQHFNLYQSCTWFYLDFDREIFDYKTAMIESDRNQKLQPLLGESAVSDLWLLSHGQVFVGNLGSRFGKMGWILSVARHNAFVPYYSVDGHSFCCDIDEPCGQVAPYIRSMNNCIGFTILSPDIKIPNYWTLGNLKRQFLFNVTNYGQ